jgi:hypothetical protein
VPGDRRGAARREEARGGGLTRVGAASRNLWAASLGSRLALVERAYRHSTRVLGGALFVLGVAILVSTLVRGGGPLALGVVIGIAFALLGAGRVFLATREGSPRGRP